MAKVDVTVDAVSIVYEVVGDPSVVYETVDVPSVSCGPVGVCDEMITAETELVGSEVLFLSEGVVYCEGAKDVTLFVSGVGVTCVFAAGVIKVSFSAGVDISVNIGVVCTAWDSATVEIVCVGVTMVVGALVSVTEVCSEVVWTEVTEVSFSDGSVVILTDGSSAGLVTDANSDVAAAVLKGGSVSMEAVASNTSPRLSFRIWISATVAELEKEVSVDVKS